jgi:hypothetical protein
VRGGQVYRAHDRSDQRLGGIVNTRTIALLALVLVVIVILILVL